MSIKDDELDQMQKEKQLLIKAIDRDPANKEDFQRQLKNLTARIKTRTDKLVEEPTMAKAKGNGKDSKALIDSKKAAFRKLGEEIRALVESRAEKREQRKVLSKEIKGLKNAN